ncbi:uncharacterized protein LOC135216905 isoform X2 [Macrobrachium nipponense]|uniref:uncharacterized protein LOC135216905 isoform X2 n=1 Tax=Macrobrachium nipponense TaxID=159736 RepID=UPI0030C80FFE
MSFVVVEFLHEEAVEVVHKSWIVKKENVVYCYWPPKAGASAKVKREEMPDKERWNLHEIRLFSFAETYTKALERAKRAEDTSNVETDQECLKRRTTKKPDKFGFSDNEEDDDEDGDSLQICRTPTVAMLPQPPQLNEANGGFDASSRDSSSLPYQRKVHRNGSVENYKSESTPEVSQRFKGKLQLNKRLSLVGAADEATSSRTADLGLKEFIAVSEAEAADARYRATLLARLKTIEENQRLMVNLLQSVAASVGSGGEDVDDVLPAPVCSLEELDDLCTKLTDETFKKKLTLYLSS